MNIAQIEKTLSELVIKITPEAFIYDLLLAYGTPKTTVTLLKKGKRNLAEKDGQIILKRKLFFQETQEQDIHDLIDNLKNDDATHRHDPRFIVVTDYKTLLAIDTKTDDTLDIKIEELNKHPFFFGPWAKIEKNTHYNEQEADVKAAEKMAEIYDEILKYNHFKALEDLHELNIFLSRLLFCFFAEDTGIFKDNAFTNAISSHTQEDGSDLDNYLNKLFEVLNTANHSNYPDYLAKFPYVNGGLFGDGYFAPKFSRKARRMIIKCGELDWAKINPDIFGSMFQAVVHKDQRSSMGQHYTSVPNIMKVIEPLFLNELREEFNKHYDNQKKLEQLLARLEKLRIFDPACGSGNFLIIAYKEICKLEMEIFQRIQEITDNPSLPFSRIQLSQFYGIELDDFAHEVAILSLWLAEHQMNVKFEEVFGQTNPTLPLKKGGNIVCGNATRIPWEDVCPKDKYAEIYVLGNPPYLGGKFQEKTQKDDMKYVLGKFKKYNNVDYIGCWFYLAATYINQSVKVAFVSTNSISQGTQVNDLWPNIINHDSNLEIFFAVKDFLWTNNAKNKAGVTCIIIGLRTRCAKPKYIIYQDIYKNASTINAYLLDAPEIYIEKRTTPLSKLPFMKQGNIPLENGILRLSETEKKELIIEHLESEPLFKKISGSSEFINNIQRWCLWITNDLLNLANSIPPVKKKIDEVYNFRKTGAENAKACLDRSHQFCMVNTPKNYQIIIPIVSSIRRDYIPTGYVDKDTIVINSALCIEDAETYIFGLLNSKIHIAWVKAFAGKLKTDFRYSVGLCWYSFPVPDLTEKQKETITTHVYNVLEEREKHSEKTMAELYDPEKMPDGLREAHHHLDLAVERCYRSKPFTSEEERLEYLFKLYENMTTKEKSGGLL